MCKDYCAVSFSKKKKKKKVDKRVFLCIKTVYNYMSYVHR